MKEVEFSPYPSKPINWWKLAFIGTAILFLIAWFNGCFKQKIISVPVVTSVPAQKARITHDSIMSQRDKDSVGRIVANWQGIANKNYRNFLFASTQYHNLEEGMNELLTREVPDTCKAMQALLRMQFYSLSKQGQIKDSTCIATIAAKDAIIEQKDALIQIGSNDYRKLRANTDTCLNNQLTLEAFIKKTKPKGELFVGLTGMSNYQSFSPTIGLSVGYRTKKGVQVEIGSTLRKDVFLSIKKQLFRL